MSATVSQPTALPSDEQRLPAVGNGGQGSAVLARLRRLDWWLVSSVVLLLGFGCLMILSASSLHADSQYGDPAHYVMRQGMGIAAGVVAVVVLLASPFRWLRLGAWPLYLVALVGLVLVFAPEPIGHSVYGSARWIRLGGINIQPSEFAKIGLILVMAHYLTANQGRLSDVLGVGLPAVGVAVPMVVLLMLEPDFGTTVITASLMGVMLFVAGLHWAWGGSMAVLGGAGLFFMGILAPYRWKRLTSFLDPFADVQDGGHQVIQGWIAMASGGWFGQGMASGVAQRGNLPEAHTDFISAVVGEELGVMGWGLLIVLYLIVFWRGISVVSNSKDLFTSLVASAVTVLLASQTLINLGVVVGWMPAKGLVLPFMSYGASAVVAHLICIGLLLRLSMHNSEPKGVSS